MAAVLVHQRWKTPFVVIPKVGAVFRPSRGSLADFGDLINSKLIASGLAVTDTTDTDTTVDGGVVSTVNPDNAESLDGTLGAEDIEGTENADEQAGESEEAPADQGITSVDQGKKTGRRSKPAP